MPLIEYKDRHELPDENAVAIFDHITKTGGATINSVMMPYYEKKYGAESQLLVRPYDLHFIGDTIRSFDDIRFIHGHAARGAHVLFPKRSAFYFTFLRHPLARRLSVCKRVLLRNSKSAPTNKDLEASIYRAPQNSLIA